MYARWVGWEWGAGGGFYRLPFSKKWFWHFNFMGFYCGRKFS